MQKPIDWNQIRTNYQLLNNTTYFASSYFGAMSNRTVQVQTDCLTSFQSAGSKMYDQTIERAEDIRQKILEITKADRHHAALISDVSTPMSHLAYMFSDKKIMLLEKDFPSVSAPWVGQHCDILWVEREGFDYPLDRIENHLKDGVEVLAISWVMYNSGLKVDLKAIGEMCRKLGVVFIVDGTQGIGANHLDLSETHVDVLLASCYKWLLSGYGTGIAIATKEFEDKYGIKVAGHGSILNGFEGVEDLDNYVSGIRRFEIGHVKTLPIYALHSALNELIAIGFENIRDRTLELRDLLIAELSKIDIEILTPQPLSMNILMIEGNDERAEKLRKANIDCTYRQGLLRFGIYFYNNEEDIYRLIRALN